jgi:hypothetical protein
MALTDTQKNAMVMEVFDTKRVTLTCSKHSYFGPVKNRPEFKPHLNCPDCWRVFFVHELSECPPDKRKEKLDEMEDVLHRVVELVEHGKWDVDIYPHAEISIGKE